MQKKSDSAGILLYHFINNLQEVLLVFERPGNEVYCCTIKNYCYRLEFIL